MSLPTVVTLQDKTSLDCFPIEDALSLNPDGHLFWLQNLLFAALKRLGCSHPSTVVRKVETVQVRFDRIAEAIFQSEEMMREVYMERARYIVVGRDKFQELCQAQGHPGYMAMAFPPEHSPVAAYGGGPARKVFAGLIVVFCPWMSGMIVLPELPPLY